MNRDDHRIKMDRVDVSWSIVVINLSILSQRETTGMVGAEGGRGDKRIMSAREDDVMIANVFTEISYNPFCFSKRCLLC